MLKLLTEHLKAPFIALLRNTLGSTKGNQSKAARILGISRGALRTYIKVFNIESINVRPDIQFVTSIKLMRVINNE